MGFVVGIRTVHGFALHFQHAIILADEVVEFLGGVCDGADLVFLVDVVPVDKWVSVGGEVLAIEDYPSFSRSAGNSGSLGRVLLSRRNILMW